MNSKRVYSTVLFSFIFLTSLSCKKEPAEAEAVVKEAEKEEIIDPFYAVLNEDSSLEDYWNVFVADAIRSGKLNPGNGKVITLFFGSEPDFASGVTADHAGRAFNICDDDTVSFEIIKSFWEDFTIVQRLYTFYHEAGHARYKYRHPCESNECTTTPEDFPIMWRSVLPGNTPLEEFIRDKENFLKEIGREYVILIARVSKLLPQSIF
jgi:hypothetical protein